ncbi:MAG TPA: carbon-nitrogen hydrolase [Bdellovibrionales bacterium]|nr:MAG: hypothetical protein A2Z97_04935 [Bdellovibrionales bacterium GWB1_52_6]OFZ03884.1 MAG: hypothetical protein A2X97_15915 [Bdellovibrionales bacterium GWA1_52_35]OFZ39480.1 MAG: hypothetical protein A2070_06705 [Bdellovibrionales bacterium GWC1_52_8]HAR43522.1 carbon-nitrogen hydrolase [Bdellovibrionales bacterium]HCM39681.1 carbon-nitrogen hydrolase [Bdellovibrionales bacterium]
MKVTLCQMDIAWQNAPTNLLKIKRMLQETNDLGAELVIFPEMCLTGFSMKPDEAALPPDSPLLTELLALTRGRKALVLAGAAVRRPEGPYNECWAMRDGLLVGVYQKVNLFSFAGEHEVYRPGKKLLLVSEGKHSLAPVICYDLRFSELFLKAAERVTGAFVVIANWPSARREQWKTLLRARALDTQTYVIGVNRVGSGNGLGYSGDSAIFDPAGRQLNDFRSDEAVITVDLDLEETSRLRERFPVLADRGKLNKQLQNLEIEESHLN